LLLKLDGAMKAFVWNDRFETGLPTVDEQHRRLVEVVNELGAVLIDGSATEESITATFVGLADYAKRHFADEERLMAQAHIDPRHVDAHRHHHRQFVEQLVGLWKGRANLAKPAEVLHGFLSSWLSFHILEEDHAMARQLNLVGQGAAPEQAFERAQLPADTSSVVLLGAMHELYGVLSQQNKALAEANERLEGQVAERTRSLLQAEKMAAVGQLAAGVAHEINNPIGFVNSNLGTLRGYATQLLGVLDACAEQSARDPAAAAQFEQISTEADLPYLRQDLTALLDESQDGLDRVKNIVLALKDFARADSADMSEVDLLVGLDSTIKVASNELKYKADVVKALTPLPTVHCIPGQINQVFMNLLVNAAHAIAHRGTITLRSGFDDSGVWVDVEDSGCGIAAEHLERIFEPFFTTKPVGQGTGLGLAVSWDIVVNKHHGRLSVRSQPGQGSCFTLWLPRETSAATAAAPASASTSG
jgi:hemerythrin-like metal-binding protein